MELNPSTLINNKNMSHNIFAYLRFYSEFIRGCLWKLTAAAAMTVVLNSTTIAAEGPTWPQWRGPDRTGVSQETGLLQEWPDEGPQQLWLYSNAGIGYSGPAVIGDQLFTMGARDNVEYLIALNAHTGKEVWIAEIGSKLENNWGDGPRGTPSVDGKFVYALGAQGNLVCVNAGDGTVVWQKSMQDLGGGVPSWGYCESVLVDGDTVVCTPGGEKGAVVALNKGTGEIVWQSSDFSDGAQYASIIAVDHNDTHQYIQLTMEHVVSLAADDGRILWQSDWPGQTAVIPTPIFRGGNVYVTSGYGVGCKLIHIDQNDVVNDVYVNKTMKNQHGGVVLVGDYLYGFSDGVGWLCQDFASGKKVWGNKDELGKGSLTYADGRLYCLDMASGAVALIESSPEGWKEHGRFTLEPQTTLRKPSGRIWTHPVVVDGRLYLRDQDLLFCFDVKKR